MKRTSILICAVCVAVLAAGLWVFLSGTGRATVATEVVRATNETSVANTKPPAPAKPVRAARVRKPVASDVPDAEADPDAEPPKTPEELKDEADEALVETFDNLTDKWMEPSAKGVSMADVSAFVAQFAKVPADRKEECLQRALNLIPDENVMLLAGVLMDKTQPKELAELVFNDVLNRDEDVKNPILAEILKDKSHPCWADTAWILDATGEKPQ